MASILRTWITGQFCGKPVITTISASYAFYSGKLAAGSFGTYLLRDPGKNKDTAFTVEERRALGLNGLLPPAVHTVDQQILRCKAALARLSTDLDRHVYLMNLADRNLRLFHQLVAANVDALMPLIYTPTVGQACQNFSLLYERPRGLFITINDATDIENILRNWPAHKTSVIVVTDGERILGLGDLGANGMGIPVGKLALYTVLAGVPADECLPITLDVGTNTESILADPNYIGLRQRRVRGAAYYNFLDLFMEACVDVFGHDVLIQFEDFGNVNAFDILKRYKDRYCVFNDDIQGTASVALSGLFTATKLTKTTLAENKYLFYGAGEAALGIADLIVMAMKQDGVGEEEARSKIFLMDTKGLIVADRPRGGINANKAPYAHKMKPMDTLLEAVDTLKPTALIGVSATPATFTPDVLSTLHKHCPRPIVFALSNPTNRSECSAHEAYTHTKGQCIFASGSPFDDVELNGTLFKPGQGNNAYIFPGLGLAVTTGRIHPVKNELFVEAARALSREVKQTDLDVGRIYPPLDTLRTVSQKIAVHILEYAYKHQLAHHWPEPVDKEAYIKKMAYHCDYPTYN